MKKLRGLGFLLGLLLAVAFGIRHVAYSQSAGYVSTWAQEAWSNALQSPVLPATLSGQTPISIPESEELSDPTGQIGSYQVDGPTITSQNAFFSSSLGTNQRNCFTCHQPQDGWALTSRTVQSVYQSTKGKGALFQPVDGSNCPNLGAAATSPGAAFISARSQLFTKANIRIFLPLPPSPEWASLTLVNDPYGCENSATYGVPAGFVSMYRRPLPTANVVFLDPAGTRVPAPPTPPLPQIPGLSGVAPEGTGFAIMWDSREPDLPTQFQDAVRIHAQATSAQLAALTADEIQQGVTFQQGNFTAQSFDNSASDLTGRSDRSGATGGAAFLASQTCGSDISFCLPLAPTFLGVQQFTLYPATFSAPTGAEETRRASILRGQAIFNGGVHFLVNGVSGFNNVLGPNFRSACNTCHNVQNIGNNFVLGPLHTGIADNSYLSPIQTPAGGVPTLPPTPDLPLFAFYCPTGSIPFFSNPVAVSGTTYDLFETTDPGLGLITGKCADLGKMKTPILRGLASRAPYFHGGNASSLQDLVNFYNKRFNIGLTSQQQTDLVNFLNTL